MAPSRPFRAGGAQTRMAAVRALGRVSIRVPRKEGGRIVISDTPSVVCPSPQDRSAASPGAPGRTQGVHPGAQRGRRARFGGDAERRRRDSISAWREVSRPVRRPRARGVASRTRGLALGIGLGDRSEEPRHHPARRCRSTAAATRSKAMAAMAPAGCRRRCEGSARKASSGCRGSGPPLIGNHGLGAGRGGVARRGE